MKLLTHIPSWIKDKFFIAITVFAFVILIFDKNDLFTQMDRIATERAILDKMKTNPGTLEKYAREKYMMKRDNEDLYIIPENSPNSKN
jgi:cell division protein DivIC